MNFTKMQAYSNDYVYISLLDGKMDNPSAWAKFVSDRHKGVGSDGMILICPSEKADFRMRVFNPDGSEAEMCGNALRSTGKLCFVKGWTDKTDFTVETLGGIKKIHLWTENGKVVNVSANIGKPIYDSEKIPVTVTNSGNALIGYEYKVYDKTFRLTALSLGNPHVACETADVFALDLKKYGPAIECSPLFPKKANVHFYEVTDRGNINMRAWERNCGETLACATGCTTVTCAAVLDGKADKSVDVHQIGGIIHIDINTDGTITMTGETEIVFDGVIPDDAV